MILLPIYILSKSSNISNEIRKQTWLTPILPLYILFKNNNLPQNIKINSDIWHEFGKPANTKRNTVIVTVPVQNYSPIEMKFTFDSYMAINNDSALNKNNNAIPDVYWFLKTDCCDVEITALPSFLEDKKEELLNNIFTNDFFDFVAFSQKEQQTLETIKLQITEKYAEKYRTPDRLFGFWIKHNSRDRQRERLQNANSLKKLKEEMIKISKEIKQEKDREEYFFNKDSKLKEVLDTLLKEDSLKNLGDPPKNDRQGMPHF